MLAWIRSIRVFLRSALQPPQRFNGTADLDAITSALPPADSIVVVLSHMSRRVFWDRWAIMVTGLRVYIVRWDWHGRKGRFIDANRGEVSAKLVSGGGDGSDKLVLTGLWFEEKFPVPVRARREVDAILDVLDPYWRAWR